MWKLIDSKKIDVLKMTQDNLEATQKNNQLLAEFLEAQLSKKTPQEEFAEKIDVLKLTQDNLDATQKSNQQTTELLKEEIADKDEIIKQTQISNQQMIDIVKEELSDKMQILKQTQDNLDAIQKNNQQLVEISKEEFTDKIDVLKMTQENLDATQKNNQLLTGILLSQLTANNQEVPQKTPEEIKKEQLKAAYALNLCTVSVSQIIDYNDIYFLEREYDAILNNLNLEKMPKDEALLRILKQLLDVITFFRIQEGERKMMEKEYAQKIKNAIWSAVPNPAVLITGGSPVAIVASLVSQVGIGYMNYRKEKAQINSEKERKEWELQRSAMEQFNGLRRELFDTAWRLADEYDFPDKYRITERQITQYNNILLDTNDLRRYERLEYIEDKFQAYPPFLYNIGNAASAVYHDKKNYKEEIRNKYKKKAIDHFDKFFENTEDNILREDQLVASCALEKFALIEDKAEKIELLQKAEKFSGNALDVLQICAFSYLNIDEVDKAAKLFNMLVNEGYNEKLNAQWLSKIYVSKCIQGDTESINEYEKLETRTSAEYLFPLPKSLPVLEYQKNQISEKFVEQQKNNLKTSFVETLSNYVVKCQAEYNAICKQKGNITSEMLALVKNMANAFEFLADAEELFLESLQKEMNDNPNFKKMIECGEDRNRGIYSISFDVFFEKPVEAVVSKIKSRIIRFKSMDDISKEEIKLHEFETNYDISLSYAKTIEADYESTDSLEKLFDNKKLEKEKKIEAFVDVIKNKHFTKDELIIKDNKTEFILREDSKFKPYFKNKLSSKISKFLDIAFAILDEKFGHDLIFTTEGLVITGVRTVLVEYKDIERNEKTEKKLNLGSQKYDNDNINLDVLNSMVKEFALLANELNGFESNSLVAKVKNIMLSSK